MYSDLFKRCKLDIRDSKNLNQLKVAKSYLDLAKFHLNFREWNILRECHEIKLKSLTYEL